MNLRKLLTITLLKSLSWKTTNKFVSGIFQRINLFFLSVTITSPLALEFKKIQATIGGPAFIRSGISGFRFSFAHHFNPPKIARNYRKIVKKSGLPYIRFHELWYTHATLLLQQGIHPKVVSER